MMINEQKIRLFLSLANTLNFTETANQLFITQQAVSKHISQLEDDLGFPLFIRSPHSVRLTPAGERCKIFFQAEMERITSFIANEKEEQLRLSKSLRLGYNNWLDFGNAVVSARVRFSNLHPEITHVPERQPPDLLQRKLRDGELDIILVLKRFIRNETGFRIIELTKFPMSIVIKTGLVSEKAQRDLSHLSEYPLFINSFSGESVAETTSRAKREMELLGLTNKKIIITPNRDSVYIAVETGEGIATSCINSQLPPGITAIPTQVNDTLVCMCLDTTKRKLIHKYMDILQDEFKKPENNI